LRWFTSAPVILPLHCAAYAGSPALLALLHKLVAAAAGLQLTAVTLPGHTFLQPLTPTRSSSSSSSSSAAGWSASPYLIDPFNAGQVSKLAAVALGAASVGASTKRAWVAADGSTCGL
jgi:hypothetical protein